MDIKSIFVFLVVVYIVTVLASSFFFNKAPGHFALPYIIIIAISLIYFVISIYLTIQLYRSGSFNWISNNPNLIKITLIIGLAAILYLFFTSVMIRLEWATYQDQSINKLKNFFPYTSYIWVPLLMIIPYYFIIFKNENVVGLLVKLPLVINACIGILLYMYFHFGGLRILISEIGNLSSSENSRILKNIESTNKVIDLLQYTKPIYEDKIKEALWDKIMSNPNYEEQLLEILSNCESYYSFTDIYSVLCLHPIVNQEKYIEPINKSMTCVINLLEMHNNNPDAPQDYLKSLNINSLITVLDYQFSFNFNQFKEKLILIEKSLKKLERENLKSEAQDLLYQLEKLNAKHKK